jgi:hypothetical protein
MRAAALLLLLACSGCAAVPPAVLGAAFGFGAAALNLDTELVKAYLELREPAPPVTLPNAGAEQGRIVLLPNAVCRTDACVPDVTPATN